jgi:Xaa-Pro aminopeptidase
LPAWCFVALIDKLPVVKSKSRIGKLQSAIEEHRLDALVVSHLPNIRYLCGFTGSSAVLLVKGDVAVLFTDGRYTQQVRDEARGAKVVITPMNLEACGEWLRKSRSRRVGIEGEHFSVVSRRRLSRLVPSGSKLVEAPSLIEQARMIKDEGELEKIRSAVKVGAHLFLATLKAIESGKTESEVVGEMEYAARKAGAEGMSFSTIIAGGKRSALPHARASRAAIPRGFVVCDFGVILDGYCSDRTRTVFKGRPTSEARELYKAVLESQQAGIEAVKPGATCGEVDDACRKLLQRHKLAKYFTHSTGHGVGLEIHEAPRLAAKQKQILQPGMVITIEPGVYLPNKWGVRIEDMVLVTEKGHEVLSPQDEDKELITI